MEEKKSMWEKAGPLMMVAIVAMAFGLGYFYNKSQTPVPTPAPLQQQAGAQQAEPTAAPVTILTIKSLFANNDLIHFGTADQKLLLVEISDPSCPYCSIASGKNSALNKSAGGGRFTLVADGGTYVAPVPEMKKLVEAGKAGFVWIFSPGHGNGEMGTKALFCANEKGKFWDVHDLLMNEKGYDLLNNTVKNDKTQSQTLANFLAPAVDASFMKSCLDSGKYEDRITKDPQVAASLGVRGTPGFFINTTNFAGAYSWNDMKRAAETALK